MASLFKIDRSPFWYLQFKTRAGLWETKSTKLRHDDPDQTRKARAISAERTAQELTEPQRASGEGWKWVPRWMSTVHINSPKTLARKILAWDWLDTYLREENILIPRLLTREHCLDYVSWRNSSKAKKNGRGKVAHNTILLELKCLSGIMREAVHRQLAGANPCLQLGLKRLPGKEKPRFTPEQESIVEAALKIDKSKHIVALRRSWEIAMKLGCRLLETCIPLTGVNLTELTVTFTIKGGREHTQNLHPDLVPLFTQLKKQGKQFAFDMPSSFSSVWLKFFRRHGLPGVSFHSTRVTVVSKLSDAGVDERVAMDYVGHSSVIVHRQYRRAKRAAQDAAVQALGVRSSPPSSSEIDSKKLDAPPST